MQGGTSVCLKDRELRALATLSWARVQDKGDCSNNEDIFDLLVDVHTFSSIDVKSVCNRMRGSGR